MNCHFELKKVEQCLRRAIANALRYQEVSYAYRRLQKKSRI
ncbi:hypothetical protein [uncultured Nostoc sp.]